MSISERAFAGYVYTDGHRITLAKAPNWSSVKPVGISRSGVIVADVRVGDYTSGQHYVVTWQNATAPYHVVARTGTTQPASAVDGNGDIAYLDSAARSVVRRPSGAITVVGHDQQQELTFGDRASSFYGDVSSEYGPQQTPTRWTVQADGTVPAQRVAPAGADNAVTAAGSRGALVSGYLRPQHLRTPDGGYVPMPAELQLGPAATTGTAVAASGTVAYTSPTDGLVHFFSCR